MSPISEAENQPLESIVSPVESKASMEECKMNELEACPSSMQDRRASLTLEVVKPTGRKKLKHQASMPLSSTAVSIFKAKNSPKSPRFGPNAVGQKNKVSSSWSQRKMAHLRKSLEASDAR